jgi:amidase
MLGTAAATPLLALVGSSPSVAQAKAFEFDESTVTDLAERLRSGQVSSRTLTEAYLQRINEIDRKGPAINSVIEVNPDAIAIAEAMDKQREGKASRGPLYGIPVLIKDNIDTKDQMHTTAGSLAMLEARPAKDSAVARKLRAAGAVIIGKTNLSEWANIRSSHSTSGWTGRGGLTRNPYALDRNASGSSSGTGAAIAANLAAVGVGTETDGSIISPSTSCGLVGMKPTVGLISRSGIIPISESQDTAGPMTRTVRDAAILLGVLAGADADDRATAAAKEHAQPDYTRFLDAKGLKGARIGVLRKLPGFGERTMAAYEEALRVLSREGAILIDEADGKGLPEFNEAELTVLLYELKAGLNAYLARLGKEAPVKTLADVIAFNEKNKDREMPYFGQDLFVRAQALGPLTDKKYRDSREQCLRYSRVEINGIMAKNMLDALVAPSGGPAWLTDFVNGDHFAGSTTSPAAVAGYPAITVPMGHVFGLPVGLSFFARAWSEPTLLKLAYAFEQATKVRKAPRFLPSANVKA